MRKKATRKRPYFTMESTMTAISRNASGKMHHGILFAPPLGQPRNIVLRNTCATIVLGGSQFTRCIPLSKREAKIKNQTGFFVFD